MSFKLKGTATRAKYHNLVVSDSSGVYYTLEYQQDGYYAALDRNNKVINGNINVNLLDENIQSGKWKLFEQMPIFKNDSRKNQREAQ